MRSLVLGFERMMTLGSGGELKMKKDFNFKLGDESEIPGRVLGRGGGCAKVSRMDPELAGQVRLKGAGGDGRQDRAWEHHLQLCQLGAGS